MEPIRTRSRTSTLELRENRRLSFYAAVFDQPTIVRDVVPGTGTIGEFREVVRPGAFLDSLKGDAEIIGNIDHDDARTFALRSRGELILSEDPFGLFATCYLPKTPLADALISDIESGKVAGASFRSRIIPDGDVWNGDLLEVVKAPLIDVCVTARPAYKATEVRVRNDNYRDLFLRMRILKLKNK